MKFFQADHDFHLAPIFLHSLVRWNHNKTESPVRLRLGINGASTCLILEPAKSPGWEEAWAQSGIKRTLVQH